ncbi:hypothetical protein FE257_008916 [Aspergillus nanangensis]|uniref:Alpha/beta hydrolase fold-3 domain-containing protein n=1 Tax=Aspergillus nanangensis TaxID=2582783 RepID=A0AAD4CWD7_ASPNN|nr:hypothetical protein FE257_008916 [Aspergillus nanangensis]
MPITSDLSIDVSKFSAQNIDEATKRANAQLADMTTNAPRWEDIGAETLRAIQDTGEGSDVPPPVRLPNAVETTVPSREKDRDIPIRAFKPENGQPSRGVMLHFHGGGFVFGSHQHYDTLLKTYADTCQLTAISVGYRLAPEHPFPAAVNDCIDAAEYMVDNAVREYGAPLLFLSGESAGGYLSAVSALQLMRSRPSHSLAGLVLQYGVYDLALGLPAASTSTKPFMINFDIMSGFAKAFLPDMSISDRRDPRVSPLYEDLKGLVADPATGAALPPAIFMCGTEDPLIDDTIMMSVKWSVAGGEGIVKIYPGAAHGFTGMPGLPVGDEANAVAVQFVQEKLAGLA